MSARVHATHDRTETEQFCASAALMVPKGVLASCQRAGTHAALLMVSIKGAATGMLASQAHAPEVTDWAAVHAHEIACRHPLTASSLANAQRSISVICVCTHKEKTRFENVGPASWLELVEAPPPHPPPPHPVHMLHL
jgi:hypothetical protein